MAFRVTAEGLEIALRVTPNARQAGIEGLAELDDGRRVLKIKVSAPPEDGKANAAVIKLLSKAWGLPKSRLSITAGERARMKTLLVAGEGAALARRLTESLERV